MLSTRADDGGLDPQGQPAAWAPGRSVHEDRFAGRPTVNLDRALQVAAELEDEELVRRMRRGG